MVCGSIRALQIVEVGVPAEDAEKLLAKAFGWRGQVCYHDYWDLDVILYPCCHSC